MGGGRSGRGKGRQELEREGVAGLGRREWDDRNGRGNTQRETKLEQLISEELSTDLFLCHVSLPGLGNMGSIVIKFV